MANDVIIKVRNLSKSYGKNLVLDDISFDLEKGKIIGLLGPNGCGKTTLIKILSGLIHDYDGIVRVDDAPPGIHTKGITAYSARKGTYLADWFRPIDAINYFNELFSDLDDKNKASGVC